jgi:hypothetical protein
LTSMDSECAQNVPKGPSIEGAIRSLKAPNYARHAVWTARNVNQ